jgi:predicted nucleic acid-binding protein
MYKLSIDNVKEVLNMALKKNLTFYDASHIYVAEKNKLKLVTKDKEILRSYNKAINVEKLLEELTK